MGLMDIISLLVTVAIFAGVIYGVIFATQLINSGVKSTKESLKRQGVDISDHGVKVKTNKRFDREDYVDATQRGIIKAMGAASFRRGDETSNPGSPSGSVPRTTRTRSNQSTNSTGSGRR